MKTSLKLAALLLPLCATAHASSPALAGWTEPGSVSCFTRNTATGAGAGVRNQCTSAQNWFIPFHIGSSGSKSVSVLAARPSSAVNVCCGATSIDGNGNLYQNLSTTRCLPSSSLIARITVGSISVPSFGTLFVTCNVGVGATVISATY